MAEAREAGVVDLLQDDERKDLLRLVFAGSVDDGKSTLIGRLLYESKGIYEDQLDSVRDASQRVGTQRGNIDLALVTDGLKSEREQGITIDVAYRYFSTPRRKFIIADTPGHEQYTRNMATGASTANLAIVLIDAKQGVLTQSRRHSFIASLLGIPHVVVAINKMDLVDYSERVFRRIVQDYRDVSARLEIPDVTFIPISALTGDNVVERSQRMNWYQGPTLLNHLETVHIASDRNFIDLRFPVQYVSRPDSTFRGYVGTVASGIVRPGDEILVLPSGRKTRVREVLGVDDPLDEAFPPLPCTLTLEDDVDVSRGDMLVHPRNVPALERSVEAMIVWMDEKPLDPSKQYTIKHAARQVPGTISDIRYRIDMQTLHRQPAEGLQLNEIGRCLVDLARPLPFDPYKKNRTTGSFIVIDRETNGTVGAGMILYRRTSESEAEPAHAVTAPAVPELQRHESLVSPDERAATYGHRAATVWLTGMTGAGKTTIAYALERRLFEMGVKCCVLDGENIRLGLNKDLSFSAEDRTENIRRAAETARILNDAGLLVICAFLSPNRAERESVKSIVGKLRWAEVSVTAPMDVLRSRADRDQYDRAERGDIRAFPGISAQYEPSAAPDLTLRTDQLSVDGAVTQLLHLLHERGWLPSETR
jgi:bifunctional enzyme CysN/CysC